MTEPKSPSRHLFLHAQFSLPHSSISSGNDQGSENHKSTRPLQATSSSPLLPRTLVEHHFDYTIIPPTVIGLKGEPVKPKPGDYTYSGMHDHGPLPKPKEGGAFAILIGLCEAAKQSSDRYLTVVIEQETK
ncbi:hypothetical protein ACHAW6_001220 [Cyclotella cf. meneghiniana]